MPRGSRSDEDSYYLPQGGQTVYRLLQAPVSVPQLAFQNQPAGAGHGRYWFTAVDPVTGLESAPGPAIVDDARNTTMNTNSATASASRNLQFVHRDHLGSTRLMTDEQGDEIGRWKYYPFGMLAEGGASTGSRMKFTGHERDHGGTELDYMRARYYSSGLGVFLSVDPLLASARPVFPSSWNRYAYVLNSPVALVDPSGMYVVSCTEQGGACEAMSKAFEAARQADLRRGGKIEAVAAAYGEPGVDDGVTIKFGKLKEGGVGGEFVGSIDFSKSAGAFVLTATVTIDMRFKSTHLEAIIGHEGSHLLDAQTYLKVFGSWDMETISNSSPTTEQSERRAYWISHKILDAGNEIGMFPTATIDVKLGEGVSVRDVDAIISRILTGEDYAKKLQTPLIGGYKLP